MRVIAYDRLSLDEHESLAVPIEFPFTMLPAHDVDEKEPWDASGRILAVSRPIELPP